MMRVTQAEGFVKPRGGNLTSLKLYGVLTALALWGASLFVAVHLGGQGARKDCAEDKLALQTALVEAGLKATERAIAREAVVSENIRYVERQVPVLKEVIRANPVPAGCPAGDDPFVDSLREAVDGANARIRKSL